jgi:hypothetical protein
VFADDVDAQFSFEPRKDADSARHVDAQIAPLSPTLVTTPNRTLPAIV